MNKREIIKYHIDAVQNSRELHCESLGLQLENIVENRPDHPAIIHDNGIMTYKELNASANQYAGYFAANGFEKGDVVALLMSNRPEMIAILAGLSKLGITIALQNYDLRGEVLASGINLVEAKAIIVGQEFIELYASVAGIVRLYSPRKIYVEGDKPDNMPNNFEWINPLLENVATTNPAATSTICSDDILAYIYTSGNFGPRKAVPVEHRRFLLVGHQSCIFCHMNEDRRQYVALPLYLNIGLNVCLGSMFVSGSTIVLKSKFSVRTFWDDIAAHNIDYFVGAGEMLRYLFSMPESEKDNKNTLEVIICNGISKELQEPFRERFNIDHVIEIYGTTENIGFFINYMEHPGLCGNLNLGGIRQGEVVCCDQENGNVYRDQQGRVIPCKVGEKGVLLCAINDYNSFPGYLGDPEASQLKLVHNALQEGDCYLNTFDLVELHEEDNISFVDRLGHAYRWKAKTVSAQLVANLIIRFLGPVEDACVYSVKIPGYEGRCGMAAIKLLPEEKLNWNLFTDYLDRKMPDHAKPVFIRLITDLPSGKNWDEMVNVYRKDNYSPGTIKDKLFYYDINSKKYSPLTMEVYENIQNGNFRI